MLWHGFRKVIETKHSEENVLKLLAQKNWCSIVPNLKCVSSEHLVFMICKNNLLVTDSFQPVFKLKVLSTDSCSKVCVNISTKRPTKIMMAVYTAGCTLFQFAMLGMWFRGDLDFSIVMFLPFFLLLFSWGFVYFSLLLASRCFLKALRDAVIL